MKTVDLSCSSTSLDELLSSARHESVFVKSTDGDTFIVSHADQLTTEVELLRRNHKFLELLAEFKSDNTSVSLDEVETRIRGA